ncbi:MAG: hypothetical protein Q8P02_00175, partial [Candidatus Micrarchaeota archaeon]|nr:hypothetical protein [Candidatus Micrarchaeota archaeon]
FGLWSHRGSLRHARIQKLGNDEQLSLEFHHGQLDLAALRAHILEKIKQGGPLAEEVEKSAQNFAVSSERLLGEPRGFSLGTLQENATHFSQVNPENAHIQVRRGNDADEAGMELLECLKKALKKPD